MTYVVNDAVSIGRRLKEVEAESLKAIDAAVLPDTEVGPLVPKLRDVFVADSAAHIGGRLKEIQRERDKAIAGEAEPGFDGCY